MSSAATTFYRVSDNLFDLFLTASSTLSVFISLLTKLANSCMEKSTTKFTRDCGRGFDCCNRYFLSCLLFSSFLCRSASKSHSGDRMMSGLSWSSMSQALGSIAVSFRLCFSWSLYRRGRQPRSLLPVESTLYKIWRCSLVFFILAMWPAHLRQYFRMFPSMLLLFVLSKTKTSVTKSLTSMYVRFQNN